MTTFADIAPERLQAAIDDIRAVAAQREAEQNRAEERAAKTWSSVPPTVNGAYWWRLGKGHPPKAYNIANGQMWFLFYTATISKSIGGQWLPVVMPGPENEPGMSDD